MNIIFDATIKKYEAIEAEAKANLSVCFATPTLDVFDIIERETERLANAQAALKALNETFKEEEEEPVEIVLPKLHTDITT
jgi:hypothetical protein